MESIDKVQYLKLAIENNLVLKLNWVIAIFALSLEENDYFTYVKSDLIAKINNDKYILTGAKKGEAIFGVNEPITIDADFTLNNDIKLDTTVGKVLLNHVLLVNNFGNKIPYQTGVVEVKDIENKYIARLLKDDDKLNDKSISIKEYIKFVDSCTYLQNWADIISVSSTPKSMLPPPGIKEYRKKLLEEAIKEHGPDALKDYSVIVEIENKLKAYDKEYLKDDPSLGRLMGGKILNNSRKKLFLMSGAEKGFKGTNDDALLLDKSLDEGWDEDPEKLADNFNTIRHASYSRGNETFKGGLTAKILLRATSAITVEGNDCNTKGFKLWNVTNDNAESLVGRYIIISDKPVLVEDLASAKKYVGNVVKLRSPMYCVAKGESICKICAGAGLSDNKNSVSLLVTNIGSVILNLSMKAMHNTTISTEEVNMNEIIS